MNRITLKGGPLDGRTYDFPDGQAVMTMPGGHYKLGTKTGKWYALPEKVDQLTAEVQPEPEDTNDPDAGGVVDECPKHKLTQSRDGKPKWCKACGLDADGVDQR